MAVALAVFIALVAIGLWQGNADRYERGARQEPRGAQGSEPLFVAKLRSVPYAEDVLTTVLVSRVSAEAPAPPGLSHFPAPGEVWVSPELDEQIAAKPELSRAFPGRIVGQVGTAGLQSPDQLFAVVGLDATDNKGAARAVGWGNTQPTNDRAVLPVGPFLAILLLMVGYPLVVFARIIADLGADARRRRLAALHLLGVPGRVLIRAVGWETANRAAAGALVGIVLALATAGPLARSGLLGLAWFPPGTLVPVGQAALAVVLILLVVVVTACRDAAASLVDPLQARAGREPRRSGWRRLPLIVGLGLLAGIVARDVLAGVGGSAGPMIYLFYGGAVLALTGAALALPELVRGAAMVLPSGTRRPWLFVAKRRLEEAPGRVAQAASALLVVVSVGLVGFAAIADVRALDTPSSIGDQLTVTLSGTRGLDGQREALATPARARVLQVPDDLGGGTFASCADLAAVARQQSRSTARTIDATCRDGGTYTFIDPTDGRPQPVAPGSTPVVLPELVRTTLSGGLVQATNPQDLTRVARGASLLAYVSPDRSDDYVAEVLGHDPLASVVNTGSSSYSAVIPTIERVLRSGIAAGALIGLATLLLALIDAGRTGRAQAAVLRAMGASRRQLSLAEGAQFAVGLAAVLMTGLLTGGLAGSAYLVVGATGADLVSDLVLVGGWSLGVLGGVVAVVLWRASVRGEPEAALLRRE
ncbi:hypothetical protein ACFJIY_12535 [Pimelobacter simplex]|uniref:hypothetical protein n=1 Tax=Nocardioides simplex TaxID=2045 RepID=UPI003671A84E